MNKESKIIVVDADGTLFTNDFPKIGKDIGAVPVLKKLIAAGHKLVLFTMRCDGRKGQFKASDKFPDETGGPYLRDAIYWFLENEIPLYGVQSSPDQWDWTESPKAYGNLYIDDNALGCPLKYDKSISEEPFVDWEKVEEMLTAKGLI